MGFTFTDDLTAHFYIHGYTVFRQIIPPSLLEDLRRATDRAREIAQTTYGRQAQRLTPVWEHDVDMKPFWDYTDLPELTDAVQRVTSPRHSQGLPHSVLLEPADRPYTIGWHRDWRGEVGDDKVREVQLDIDHLNQFNAPLYDDDSLWVVPGSHFRADLPSETEYLKRFDPDSHGVIGSAESAAFAEITKNSRDDELKLSWAEQVDAMPDAEREYRGLQYCAGMPGAKRLALGAGDVAIYRQYMWHLGSYVPYKKRATLHGPLVTPAWADWCQKMTGKDVLNYEEIRIRDKKTATT